MIGIPVKEFTENAGLGVMIEVIISISYNYRVDSSGPALCNANHKSRLVAHL